MINETRNEELEEKDEMSFDWSWGGDTNWLWGIVLVVGGGLLLLQNFTSYRILDVGNWWAIFILVPGISNLMRAWRSYRLRGTLTNGARNSAFWGFVLVAVALNFFFSFGWGLMMPLLLIIGGAFLLLTARRQ